MTSSISSPGARTPRGPQRAHGPLIRRSASPRRRARPSCCPTATASSSTSLDAERSRSTLTAQAPGWLAEQGAGPRRAGRQGEHCCSRRRSPAFAPTRSTDLALTPRDHVRRAAIADEAAIAWQLASRRGERLSRLEAELAGGHRCRRRRSRPPGERVAPANLARAGPFRSMVDVRLALRPTISAEACRTPTERPTRRGNPH